jgi:hypothetical protein
MYKDRKSGTAAVACPAEWVIVTHRPRELAHEIGREEILEGPTIQTVRVSPAVNDCSTATCAVISCSARRFVIARLVEFEEVEKPSSLL